MRQITKKQQRKNKKTKSWCFEKIQQTDKPLAGLTKKRTEKIQITKLRNRRGDVITGFWKKTIPETMEIQCHSCVPLYKPLHLSQFPFLYLYKMQLMYSHHVHTIASRINYSKLEHRNILLDDLPLSFMFTISYLRSWLYEYKCWNQHLFILHQILS